MALPIGMIVLAILSILSGLWGILWGMIMAGVGGVGWLGGLLSMESTIRAWGGSAFGGGLLGMITGVVQIIVGFGLFGRQKWAWLLAAISAAFSLINPVMGLLNGNFWAIFGLVIPGLIFYYITRPDVRNAFR
jgi:hypothetical protein